MCRGREGVREGEEGGTSHRRREKDVWINCGKGSVSGVRVAAKYQNKKEVKLGEVGGNEEMESVVGEEERERCRE